MLAKILYAIAAAIAVHAFDASGSNNVAVYWGQNSAGSQGSLGEYCSSNAVDIVLLSFLNDFPQTQLNLANECSGSLSDGLAHCSSVGADIKLCQSQGKKVLLSLGGSKGNYGFSSDSEALNYAETLWNTFGGGSGSQRPFDDAVVDGFDFDIENKNQVGYTALAKQLRQYMDGDSSKTYYLSAAPQCPYPDKSVGDLMSNVPLDFAFIQYYNNYCSLNSNFNWDSWQEFAQSAPNNNIKLFLGLAASSSAAGSGYVDASTAQGYINEIKSDSNFGGVALWDASAAFSNSDGNQNYAQQIKSIIGGASSGESASSAATTTSSATSSATSSTASTLTTKYTTGTSTHTFDNGLYHWLAAPNAKRLNHARANC